MMTQDKAQEREEEAAVDEIEALLPWFAAGTLSSKDRARVEEALARDADLARRFEMVREELGETIRLNETLGAPSARAMSRLFEKIDAEPKRAAAPSLNLASRFSAFMASLSPRTLATAGAVAALAILLQAGIITGVLLNQSGGQGSYQTVSAPTSGAAQADIRFAPQATAADITKFLQDNKLTIVSGPAAGTGFFRVAVTGLPKAQLAEKVKQLQADKTINFVAPVQ